MNWINLIFTSYTKSVEEALCGVNIYIGLSREVPARAKAAADKGAVQNQYFDGIHVGYAGHSTHSGFLYLTSAVNKESIQPTCSWRGGELVQLVVFFADQYIVFTIAATCFLPFSNTTWTFFLYQKDPTCWILCFFLSGHQTFVSTLTAFGDPHRGRGSNFYHRLSNLTSTRLQHEVATLLTAVDGGDNSDVCVGLLLYVAMRTRLWFPKGVKTLHVEGTRALTESPQQFEPSRSHYVKKVFGVNLFPATWISLQASSHGEKRELISQTQLLWLRELKLIDCSCFFLSTFELEAMPPLPLPPLYLSGQLLVSFFVLFLSSQGMCLLL